MKNYNQLLLLLIITFAFIMNVNASSYVATVNDPTGLNIRSGPSINDTKLGFLAYNKTINIVNTQKLNVNDTNCSKGWIQVNYTNNTNSYICSNFVDIIEKIEVNTNYNSKYAIPSLSSDGKYYYTDAWYARINENYATVRKNASFSATTQDTIYLGTEVKILSGPTAATSGCTTGWYYINYYNSKKGYVCARLVDFYSDITATDTEYNKILKEAGFPESYWPYLTYLHQKHPNWIFKADNTKKSFAAAITGETGKNYIQTSYSVYRLNSAIRENPNWYASSSSVVAYYLDPRNYLNEKNIFSFETLSYDEKTQTKDIVESIFDGSYLVDNTENIDYVNYFMEAASTYNISPVHLASRVKQEGGTNENYDAISGISELKYNNKSLKGFYNYYNIGAYQDSVTDSAVTRGLAVAAGYVDDYFGIPWDTREKAIKYGARFIANSYISKGQDTMYYQKFNTKNGATYSSYTHQYMTNIIAPASESLSIYSAYNSLSLLDTAYTFTIPVYTNMPTAFTAHPPVGDTNNELNEIKINDSLITGFDKDVLTYNYYISRDVTEITLSATANASTSTIKGLGKISITGETTTAEIIVTSQIGIDKTYTISIIKVAKEETEDPNIEQIIDGIDVKLSDNCITSIEVDTTASNLINDINKNYPNAKVTITDSKKISKTGTLATGDIITITSGKNTSTYVISIKGDLNGDGKINSIDLLRVQKQILKYITLTNENKAAADVNYDGKINSIDLLRVQKHILGYIKIK